MFWFLFFFVIFVSSRKNLTKNYYRKCYVTLIRFTRVHNLRITKKRRFLDFFVESGGSYRIDLVLVFQNEQQIYPVTDLWFFYSKKFFIMIHDWDSFLTASGFMELMEKYFYFRKFSKKNDNKVKKQKKIKK